MQAGLHFISGLPRSGSTLLSAILRQNPRFQAQMTSPVGSLVEALQRAMSMGNESAVFISDAHRQALLHAVFDTFYGDMAPGSVAFDTNRMWCAKLPLIARLFPKSRVIACVRDVPWIFDSLERLVRTNALQPSGIFNFEPSGTVYSRVEGLSALSGLVGYAWNALREAWSGEQAGAMVLLTYETLTSDPAAAMAALYDFLGEPPFAHDFENIAYDASEFDRRLGTPGLHHVDPKVRQPKRANILPPDLIRKHENDAFWRDPAGNPQGVRVI